MAENTLGHVLDIAVCLIYHSAMLFPHVLQANIAL